MSDFGRIELIEHRRDLEIRCTPLIRESMRHLFRIRNPDAFFLQKSRRDWDGYDDLSTDIIGGLSAPIGFLNRVLKWAAADNIGVAHKKLLEMPGNIPLLPVHGGKSLDPIQEEAAKALLANRIASVELGTGSGKTITMAAAILTYLAWKPETRFTILVPRILLMRQLYKEFVVFLGKDATVGMLGDGERGLHAQVLVATPNTASVGEGVIGGEDILADLRTRDIMCLDECVARGQKILMWDGSTKPIERVSIGDSVVCYDETTCKHTISKVQKVWSSGTREVVKVITSSGDLMVTEDHPVLTQRGWVNAGSLTVNDICVSAVAEPQSKKAGASTIQAPTECHVCSAKPAQREEGERYETGLLDLGLVGEYSRNVPVDVVVKSPQKSAYRRSLDGGIPGKSARRPFQITLGVDLSGTRNSITRRAAPLSAHCTEIHQSDSRTESHRPQGFTVGMAGRRKRGLGSSLIRSALAVISTRNRTQGSATYLYCTPRTVLRHFKKLWIWFAQVVDPRSSQKRGSIVSGLSVLRGGSATTDHVDIAAYPSTQRGSTTDRLTQPFLFLKRSSVIARSTEAGRAADRLGCGHTLLMLSSISSDLSSTSGHQTMCVTSSRVVGVEKVLVKVETFDLTIEHHHNFVANGIVVHNCHRAAQNKLWEQSYKNSNPSILWAVSGSILLKTKKYKEFYSESIFGLPIMVGHNEKRTVPVTAKLYINSGDDIIENYPVALKNGVPVTIVGSDGKPVTGCKWYGKEADGTVGEVCQIRGPRGGVKIVSGIFRDGKYLDPQPASGTVLYHTLFEVGCMAHKPRNSRAIELCKELHDAGEMFVITCRRVWHVHRIVERARKSGFPLLPLVGKSNQSSVLDAFKARQTMGLVATYSTISEGVDIPVLLHIVKLDGIADEVVLKQQKGRVCRASDGKQVGYIHLPMDLHHPVLAANARRIVRRFKDMGVRTEKVDV